MKSRDLQPRLLYPTKTSFRIKGHIRSFPDKKKLNEFIITKPLLYEILRRLVEEKNIKTMNTMAKIHIYQQLNLKNRLSKQKEQRF